jgi:hypothetical protein
MTLKEKITKDVLDMPLINSPTKKEISDYEKGISNLEQIADEFAIGFAGWCLKNRLFHQFIITQKIDKELLEIYKKEKGL